MWSERLNKEVIDLSTLCVWDLNVLACDLLGYLFDGDTPVVKELGDDGEWDMVEVYLPTDNARLMWLVKEYCIDITWLEGRDGVVLKASCLSSPETQSGIVESKSNDGFRAILEVVVKCIMKREENRNDRIDQA